MAGSSSRIQAILEETDVQGILVLLGDPLGYIDWEVGDEEWGRAVDSDGGVAAIVCARVPACAVYEPGSAGPIIPGVSTVYYQSFDDRCYHVSPSVLEDVFRRRITRSINYERLSFAELWWATVS